MLKLFWGTFLRNFTVVLLPAKGAWTAEVSELPHESFPDAIHDSCADLHSSKVAGEILEH